MAVYYMKRVHSTREVAIAPELTVIELVGIRKNIKWKWAKYKKNISVTAYVIPTRRENTMSHV
jgi:hypothetical protein